MRQDTAEIPDKLLVEYGPQYAVFRVRSQKLRLFGCRREVSRNLDYPVYQIGKTATNDISE